MSRQQYLLFSILLTISLFFLVLKEPTTLALSAKISSILLFPIRTITGFLEFLTVSNARIEELETSVNQLKLENVELKEKSLIDTTNYAWAKFTVIKAQITGRDPSNINGYLFIDKGNKQGVYLNQPVISINGLIGKIKFVNTHTSIVETIENQGFAVSSIDQKTGINGTVKQRGNLIFDHIRIDDEIYIGDSIFTSGMSDIFPPGILVGTVRGIHQINDLFFKKVLVTPNVKINRLTSVYLVFQQPLTKSEKDLELTEGQKR